MYRVVIGYGAKTPLYVAATSNVITVDTIITTYSHFSDGVSEYTKSTQSRRVVYSPSDRVINSHNQAITLNVVFRFADKANSRSQYSLVVLFRCADNAETISDAVTADAFVI